MATLFSAMMVVGCERDTSSLGDGSTTDGTLLDGQSGSDRDAMSVDGGRDPDASREDVGEAPVVTEVVPCGPAARPLSVPVAGGGPLDGELTVFVRRVGLSPSLVGSRVVLFEDTRAIEGLTDSRGCIRFAGQSLRGPVDLHVEAGGHSIVEVRAIAYAEVLVSLVSAEALSGEWRPDPVDLPPGVLAGEVTGWERLPSVNAPPGETRRNVVTLMPVYARAARSSARLYTPENRPSPYAHLSLGSPIVGDSNFGSIFSPNFVELTDFELTVDAPGLVGLGAVAYHEARDSAAELESELLLVGLTRGLALTPGTRMGGLEVDLASPLTRSLAVQFPRMPVWATRASGQVEIYLPEEDAVLPLLEREVSEGMPATRLPDRQGAFADTLDLVHISFTSTSSEPSGIGRRGLHLSRTTVASSWVPPELPLALRLSAEGRALSWSFEEPRAGALLHLTAYGSAGLFELWDLAASSVDAFTIPHSALGTVGPEGEGELLVEVLWPLVPGSAVVLDGARDALDFDAIYWDVRTLDFGPR